MRFWEGGPPWRGTRETYTESCCFSMTGFLKSVVLVGFVAEVVFGERSERICCACGWDICEGRKVVRREVVLT